MAEQCSGLAVLACSSARASPVTFSGTFSTESDTVYEIPIRDEEGLACMERN